MSDIKEKIIALQKYLDSKIIGQIDLVENLIITLLADGHALLEGAPGLAKTKAIKTLFQNASKQLLIVFNSPQTCFHQI